MLDKIIVPVVELKFEASSLRKELTKPLEIQKSDVVLADPGDNIFDNLPNEIKLLILSYLTVEELCSSARVSKHWNTLTSLNCLWKQFSTSYFSRSMSMFFKTVKEEYKEDYLTLKKSEENYRENFKKIFASNASTSGLHTIFKNRPSIPQFVDENIVSKVHPLGLMDEDYIIGGNEANPSKQFIIFK